MWRPVRRTAQCPWCRRRVPVPRGYRPKHGEEIGFLRCDCGAVGLASLHPEVDWPRLAEEILGVSRDKWPDPGWGLERIEQHTKKDWDRIQRGKELPHGVDILWYPLLWARRLAA